MTLCYFNIIAELILKNGCVLRFMLCVDFASVEMAASSAQRFRSLTSLGVFRISRPCVGFLS